MSKLERVSTRVSQATALEELQLASEGLRDDYGLNHVVYHWVNSIGERFGCGTYGSDWVDRYLEKDYLYIDPVILGCFNRFDPVNWKQLDWSSKAARSFRKDAAAYGIGTQGFSVPIRGPNGQFALFTITQTCSDSEWEAFIEANQRDFILIAHNFNQKALNFEEGVFSVAHPQLSPRELSAMSLLAKGRSRAQAASEMSISEHTLRVYIEAARHKLGAMNTTHAVARALATGLIVV